MPFTRKKGLEQVNLKIALANEGIKMDPAVFKDLDYENTYLEQIHFYSDLNFETYTETKIPSHFRFQTTGFLSAINWNPDSKYEIVAENDRFYLLDENKNQIDEIDFEHKPKFYNKFTSDGKQMSKIVNCTSRGRVGICYSNECALLDKGLDCLFCNINATKRKFGERDGIEWKQPKQIAETIKEAYAEGYRGYNLTGGFVPERREVEYYLDVIDAVKEVVDEDQVKAMACVGAPVDLSVIDKYKEAGYEYIATNIEVWDKNIFKTICPGKEKLCGGYDNWVTTLEREVKVFGRGNVRTSLVGGIEPKNSLLRGVEILGEMGVIPYPSIWRPCIGSGLEGHRSPKSSWHQEVAAATYQVHKKMNIPILQKYYSDAGGEDSVYMDLAKLDGEFLPWDKPLEIIPE